MVKYVRNKEIISSYLNDEIVMLNIESGKYNSLNSVASSIWRLLEKKLSVDDICKKLIDEYEVDYAQCRKETDECLSNLLKLGLINLVE